MQRNGFDLFHMMFHLDRYFQVRINVQCFQVGFAGRVRCLKVVSAGRNFFKGEGAGIVALCLFAGQ